MKETTLLKIALICSLVGLFVLFIISTRIDLKSYSQDIVLNKNIGDDVQLTGKIIKINQRENVAFIEVSYENPVTVVVFTKDRLNLKNNETIEVIGEVQEYKGKNEIIAQKIKVIR